MNLIIDIGNTATKLAVFQAGKIKNTQIITPLYWLKKLRNFLLFFLKLNKESYQQW